MLYHSHPLETEAVNVSFSTGLPAQRPLSLRNHRGVVNSPLDTVHLLEESDYHSGAQQFDSTHYADIMYARAASDPYLAGIEVGRRLQLEEDSMHFSRYRSRIQAAQRRHDELLTSREHYCLQVERLEKEVMTLRDRLMAMQMSYGDFFVDDREREAPVNSLESEHRDHLPNEGRATLYEEERERERLFGFSDGDEDFELAQQLHFMDERDRIGGFSTIRILESRYVEVLYSIHFCVFSYGYESDTESDGYDTTSSSSSSSLLSHSSSDTPLSDDSPSVVNKADAPSPPALETELSIGELSTLVGAAQEEGNIDALEEVRLLIQDAQRTPRHSRTAAQLYLLLTWRTPSWLSPAPADSRPRIPAAPARAAPAGATNIAEVFVDASAWGIGLVMGDRWLAWRFTSPLHPAVPVDQNRRVIMSWAELIALELGVFTLIAAGHCDTTVTLRSDNLGVVGAVKQRKWTPSHGLEGILQRVLGRCRDYGIRLEVKWVSTKANPADKPSRGVLPPRALMVLNQPVLPEELEGVLKQVTPA